ncbi:MAG: radical SAM protein [Candidatus Omnitrophica bacterium]|nr:radical SAM protein [Candidatus Omnitrophota bacterium]MBU1929823.1 radical SAM protein [Candidatus Omnitrophota bacterium]MBU2035329.1 radical SAM protein [Candidatus Omnitrophota bacterium]MBU2222275.1 radical SAM protein [Candidatus Omnitrophota bacterium]MBU2257749.1 radical SAM protein [Candidatus Omnitrophota bacterium]
MLTRKCNLRCLQCDFWKINQHKDLPADSWKKIILDIRNYLGPCFLRFYGGEPFYRDDFLELIKFCYDNDTKVLITTNGTLIDFRTAEKLVKNKVFLVNISIDGFKPQTHDELRGIQGTYNKSMQAIEYLKGRVPLQINTTIMEDNLDEILSLAEFAHKNKIMISFQPYNFRIYKILSQGCSTGRDFSPVDIKKTDYIIDELCRLKRHSPSIIESYGRLKQIKYFYRGELNNRNRHCEVVGSTIKIKEMGEVFLCSYASSMAGGAIGNLTTDSLKHIWESESTHNKIREMKMCNAAECLAIRGCYRERLVDRMNKFVKCLMFFRGG